MRNPAARSRAPAAPMDPRDRLIVALDVPTLPDAEALADRLAGVVRWFKIGSQLFTAAGPAAVASIARRGRVFLDTKLHDIPSVVGAAIGAAARQGIALCTVHASGGTAMMRAAREAADAAARSSPGADLRVLGVTLLTSMDQATLAETGVDGDPARVVDRLARLARGGGPRRSGDLAARGARRAGRVRPGVSAGVSGHSPGGVRGRRSAPGADASRRRGGGRRSAGGRAPDRAGTRSCVGRRGDAPRNRGCRGSFAPVERVGSPRRTCERLGPRDTAAWRRHATIDGTDRMTRVPCWRR